MSHLKHGSLASTAPEQSKSMTLTQAEMRGDDIKDMQ